MGKLAGHALSFFVCHGPCQLCPIKLNAPYLEHGSLRYLLSQRSKPKGVHASLASWQARRSPYAVGQPTKNSEGNPCSCILSSIRTPSNDLGKYESKVDPVAAFGLNYGRTLQNPYTKHKQTCPFRPELSSSSFCLLFVKTFLSLGLAMTAPTRARMLVPP